MAKEPTTLPWLFSILAVMFFKALSTLLPPKVKNGIMLRPSKFVWYTNELIAGAGLSAQIGEPMNILSYCSSPKYLENYIVPISYCVEKSKTLVAYQGTSTCLDFAGASLIF
jgi:hypothetical protein